MTSWREMTPAQVLEQLVVLDAEQVAYVLGLTYTRGARRGQPDVRLVAPLIATKRLVPVDATVPPRRWRFSTVLVAQYIASSHGLTGAVAS